MMRGKSFDKIFEDMMKQLEKKVKKKQDPLTFYVSFFFNLGIIHKTKEGNQELFQAEESIQR